MHVDSSDSESELILGLRHEKDFEYEGTFGLDSDGEVQRHFKYSPEYDL